MKNFFKLILVILKNHILILIDDIQNSNMEADIQFQLNYDMLLVHYLQIYQQ